MTPLILELLKSALSIADTVISRKYTNQVVNLERLYYEEINKPDGERANNVLDNIDHELRIVGFAVAADLRQQKT